MQMGNLGGGPDGELLFAGEVLRDHAARLHGDGRQALVDETLLDDAVGTLEGGRNIAVLDDVGERQVGLEFVVDERAAGSERLFHVDDGGQ